MGGTPPTAAGAAAKGSAAGAGARASWFGSLSTKLTPRFSGGSSGLSNSRLALLKNSTTSLMLAALKLISGMTMPFIFSCVTSSCVSPLAPTASPGSFLPAPAASPTGTTSIA